MDWRIIVAKQAILSRSPLRDALRRFKRLHFGYEPDPRNLSATLAHLEQMKAELDRLGKSFEGATILEMGSGWFPTIPVMLAIGGAKRVLMSDISPHMDEVTFEATLQFLRNSMPGNDRLKAIRRVDDLPITYLAPFDAKAIPDGTIDFVISRTVLEHIPPGDLTGLLKTLGPKLSREGLMVHLVDHSDHLEHLDKSISKINFLTWSKRKHAWINFLIQGGENRLRHHEYQPLFERSGYRVVSSSANIHEQTRKIAASLPLSPPYSGMSPEQLAALSSLYVLSAQDQTPGPKARDDA